MNKRVGFQPVPNDVNIELFLDDIQTKHRAGLEEIIEQLNEAIRETLAEGQPEVFAYGKLMNFLASGEIPEPAINELLAIALWELK